MNSPATIIQAIDGRTYQIGPLESGQVLIFIGDGKIGGASPSAPGAHASTHEDTGLDEIDVTGLHGLLADPQTPDTHGHAQADISGLVGDLGTLASAISARELLSNKNAPNGYAGLSSGKIDIAQIPTGTSGTTVPFGDDARFSDQRTPSDNSVSTAKIQNNAVDLTKLLDIATASFLGRTTAATGDPEVLTATQATALLNIFTSALKGLVPPPITPIGNFLKDDGTWAAAGGSGGNTLYSPGSFTVATGNFNIMAKRLQLTGTQRATIEGTAQLRIV